MTEQEFLRIYTFVKSRYGIDLSSKKEIVKGRLENYIRIGGWKNYSEYMDSVESDMTGKLEGKLIDLLSTNHTYFMRESEHFEYFKNVVLPILKKNEAKTRDLCIWCGASSSGEEPYTLAMLISDFFGLEKDSWDTKILATDVSREVLERACSGIYTYEQVKVLPDNWRRHYLKELEAGVRYEMTNQIKNEVLFREFNLMKPLPFKRKMHVVFLRNVMIYFDAKTKEALLRRVYDGMEKGGYLFIGLTETIDKGNSYFKMVSPSVYQKI